MITFETFGDGWMSGNANDLCKILFTFGNVKPIDLVKAMKPTRGVSVNVRSVENAVARLAARGDKGE